MSLTSNILRLLEKQAGKHLKTADVMKHLAKTKLEKNTKSPLFKQKKRKASKKKGNAFRREEVDEILTALSYLGAIHFEKRGFVVRDPFVLRGRISLSPRGSAFVSIRGANTEARDVFVLPRDARGALPGDEVLVRLKDRSRERFEGYIVKVLSRGRKEFRIRLLGRPTATKAVGMLLDSQITLQACVDVSRLPADTRSRLKTDTVIIASLTGDDIRFRGAFFKEAEFLRFEDETDLAPDFARILMKYNLDPAYPPEIPLPDAKAEPSAKNVSDWMKRRDLRKLLTITIDGADTKDFDDALSLIPGSKAGTVRLLVHIADVSFYVKKGSPLDEEACRRSTSYYLSGRVVPMLPPALSEGLCSLVAGKNRLAFTADMTIRIADGQILKSEFYKSIIQVDYRLTYEDAEEMIALSKKTRPSKKKFFQERASLSPKNWPKALLEFIGNLYEISMKQRKARMKAGRIDLDLPEPKVVMDPKNPDQIFKIEYRERLKSSMLIEECMLSANISVAAFLRKKKAHTLYRVHDPIDTEKIDKLNQFMEAFHVPFQFRDLSYGSLRKATQAVKRHIGSKPLERIYTVQLLRSFMQAVYSPEPRGHWGLGFSDYCHFTSPIRRYPDLVVHRSLAGLLARKSNVYSQDEVKELGYHTSEQERRAMEAERDIYKLRLIRYLQTTKQRELRGFISNFRSDRVYLELADFPGEAIVKALHLTNDYELPVGDPFSVFIKKLGRPARLGEEWALVIESLDSEALCIYCRPEFGRNSD